MRMAPIDALLEDVHPTWNCLGSIRWCHFVVGCESFEAALRSQKNRPVPVSFLVSDCALRCKLSAPAPAAPACLLPCSLLDGYAV